MATMRNTVPAPAGTSYTAASLSNTLRQGSTPPARTVELDKIVQLFTGPNSAELHGRHVAAIERVCQAGSSGAAIRDLPKIGQIMAVTIELLQNGLTQFEAPLIELIRCGARTAARLPLLSLSPPTHTHTQAACPCYPPARPPSPPSSLPLPPPPPPHAPRTTPTPPTGRTLSLPFVKRSATDDLLMFANVNGILCTVATVFTFDLPAPVQIAAAEVRRRWRCAAHARAPASPALQQALQALPSPLSNRIPAAVQPLPREPPSHSRRGA